jgi:hypothetical protein
MPNSQLLRALLHDTQVLGGLLIFCAVKMALPHQSLPLATSSIWSLKHSTPCMEDRSWVQPSTQKNSQHDRAGFVPCDLLSDPSKFSQSILLGHLRSLIPSLCHILGISLDVSQPTHQTFFLSSWDHAVSIGTTPLPGCPYSPEAHVQGTKDGCPSWWTEAQVEAQHPCSLSQHLGSIQQNSGSALKVVVT